MLESKGHRCSLEKKVGCLKRSDGRDMKVNPGYPKNWKNFKSENASQSDVIFRKKHFFIFLCWCQHFCNLRHFDTKITRTHKKNFPKKSTDPSWPYHACNRAFIAKKCSHKNADMSIILNFYEILNCGKVISKKINLQILDKNNSAVMVKMVINGNY